MTWYEAVGLTVAMIGGWTAVPFIADRIDKAFQRRMSATLWSSLPHIPTSRPVPTDRVFRKSKAEQ